MGEKLGEKLAGKLEAGNHHIVKRSCASSSVDGRIIGWWTVMRLGQDYAREPTICHFVTVGNALGASTMNQIRKNLWLFSNGGFCGYGGDTFVAMFLNKHTHGKDDVIDDLCRRATTIYLAAETSCGGFK